MTGRMLHTSVFSLFLLGIVLCISCQKTEVYREGKVILKFSCDTVQFDTIFSSIGSVTEYFKVYNPYDENVLIQSVYLGGGEESEFRINIDGLDGPQQEDYLLGPKDSMYVFVEVTIDPNGENAPLIVADSVVFRANGEEQKVDLLAWGQDVHLFEGETLQTQTWTNDKPYLIYNSILLDEGQNLTIEKGVKVCFHRSSEFYIAGSLSVQGTMDEPVIFQGDRQEELYNELPGQWSGLYFLNGSGSHQMENVILTNATSGIHLGNLYSSEPPPELSLYNVRIEHMSYSGLSSIGASVNGENVLISDCGFYSMLLTAGGNYRFAHCTVANYWTYSNRITPAVMISNYYSTSEGVVASGDLVQAEFRNCIIDGSEEEELELSVYSEYGSVNYFFGYCFLKSENALYFENGNTFYENLSGEDPEYMDVYEFDFRPGSEALVRDKGEVSVALEVPYDLCGYSRTGDAGPDLGAYEYQAE